MRTIIVSVWIALLLGACHSRHRFDHDHFRIGKVTGKLQDKSIDEASGIAASVANPTKFWVHNDSGDKPRIFLIDQKGNTDGVVNLPGLRNRDWEDITVGPGPDSTKSYVYVADIGDNHGQYDWKYIYRFQEPVLESAGRIASPEKVDTIRFSLPNGPRDTETLMIDPATSDLFVISKRETEKVHVYRLAYPQPVNTAVEAEWIGDIPFVQIVGGDISSDGTEVLIKNYGEVMYWTRAEGETIADVFKRDPIFLPYATEPQGEAIAFDRSGAGYVTVSEKSKNKPPQMIFYERKNSN